MDFDPALLERLPPEKRELLEQLQAAHKELLEANPLQGFHACVTSCGPNCLPREKQHEFMASMNRIVAAFAGNRFGKTTANVVWAIIQHTPDDLLPERLRRFKRPRDKRHGPVVGRYLLPSQKTILTIVMPEFKRWCPPAILKGQSWAKAYSTQHNIINFDDGGRLEFYTYEQDPAVMVGASLDYVIYDEPPPEAHFHENLIRTTDRAGCHRFGMTPVNMKGGGIGWIKREILDQKDDPHITVVRATIHDNPLLSADEIEFTLSQFPEDERQAREYGDFIHFGGMIYPGGFERILVDPVLPPPDPAVITMPERIRYSDIYVGIDPGLKNAAFVWVAFDSDNRALAFAELLLREKTPIDYARAIRKVNSLYRIRDAMYIIDPSARNRSLTNRESVQSELMRQGIPTSWGQNEVEPGVQSVRRRIQEGGFFVGENLKGLRGEADEYRMDDREDGEFKVIKENDHRLDALRYVLMERPWYPSVVEKLREQEFVPGQAPNLEWFVAQEQYTEEGPPLGAMS
jgi:phage terminase large subunit-like protein